MLSFPMYIKYQVFPCQLKINRDDAVNSAALFISIISRLFVQRRSSAPSFSKISRIELNPQNTLHLTLHLHI